MQLSRLTPRSRRHSVLRWLGRLTLALMLVVAQHAAALHGLSHALEHTHHGTPAQTAHACCLAFHGLDDAPTPALVVAARDSETPFISPPNAASFAAGANRAAYQPRAPPTNP